MDFPPFSYVTTSIDVTLAVPRHHTDHDDGTMTLAIHPAGYYGATYLAGTMEDLHRFASAIHAALIAHETGTHPIGAAAREVAETATRPTFEEWAARVRPRWREYRPSELEIARQEYEHETRQAAQ